MGIGRLPFFLPIHVNVEAFCFYVNFCCDRPNLFQTANLGFFSCQKFCTVSSHPDLESSCSPGKAIRIDSSHKHLCMNAFFTTQNTGWVCLHVCEITEQEASALQVLGLVWLFCLSCCTFPKLVQRRNI